MTHAQLVELAAKWLAKQRCPVVITELASSALETPDAIGWRGGNSILIECKTSRGDFVADRAKRFRQMPSNGIGRQRYFLCPSGMIALEELPDRWGLLEVTGSAIRVAHQPIGKWKD